MVTRAWLVVLLVGCTGAIDDPGAGDDDGGMPGPDAAVSREHGAHAVERAMEWVTAQLQYCQAPNHQRDNDTACAMTCEREDNPLWDPYRSDCSGFVSWAWDLPAPGRTTKLFAPFKTDLTHAIAAMDLRPGDAVNNDHHMMLFAEWVVPGSMATFFDEPGCSSSMPYARQTTSMVSVDGATIVVASHGTYTAIRYDDAP